MLQTRVRIQAKAMNVGDGTVKKYKALTMEARWHIGMSSASHREYPGSNPGKGQFFRIKMKNVNLNYYAVVTLIYGG